MTLARALVAALVASVAAAAAEIALCSPTLAISPDAAGLAAALAGGVAALAVGVLLADLAFSACGRAMGVAPWDEALRGFFASCVRSRAGSAEDRALAAAIVIGALRAGLVSGAAALAVLFGDDRFRSAMGFGLVVGSVAAAATLAGSLAHGALHPALARFAERASPRWGPTSSLLAVVTLSLLTLGAAAFALSVRPALADDPRARAAAVVTLLVAMHVSARALLAARRPAAWIRVAAATMLVGNVVHGLAVAGPRPDVRADLRGSGLASGLVAVAIGAATDFDGDGAGIGVGGGDCEPGDPAIHPDARDVPANGVDENCSGSDARPFDTAGPARQSDFPLPAAFPDDLSIALVVVDSVRADALGVAGYPRRITKNMDAFAREGAYFEDAWANNPGTHASFRSFFTSLLPRAVPIGPWVQKMGNVVREDARTMAEVLGEAGLETSAILSFRYFDRGTGFDQGFDHYDNEAAAQGTLRGITAPTLLRKVETEIARLGNRRFFLLVHVLDPHHEYMVHPGYPSFGRNRRNRYDAEIAFTDDYVGRMLRAIRTGPQGKRTVVALAADHGEAFREHGVVYHNTTVYQEMLRVPLVVHLPGARPRRLQAPVSLVDLLPTFVNVVGRGVPAGIAGHSLLRAVVTGTEDLERIVYAETTDTQQPRRKLRRATSDRLAIVHDATAGTWQIFDRRRDPDELRPLGGGGGAEGERVRMALEAFEGEVARAERAARGRGRR